MAQCSRKVQMLPVNAETIRTFESREPLVVSHRIESSASDDGGDSDNGRVVQNSLSIRRERAHSVHSHSILVAVLCKAIHTIHARSSSKTISEVVSVVPIVSYDEAALIDRLNNFLLDPRKPSDNPEDLPAIMRNGRASYRYRISSGMYSRHIGFQDGAIFSEATIDKSRASIVADIFGTPTLLSTHPDFIQSMKMDFQLSTEPVGGTLAIPRSRRLPVLRGVVVENRTTIFEYDGVSRTVTSKRLDDSGTNTLSNVTVSLSPNEFFLVDLDVELHSVDRLCTDFASFVRDIIELN